MAVIDYGGKRRVDKITKTINKKREDKIPDDVLGVLLNFTNDIAEKVEDCAIYLFGGYANGFHRSSNPDIDVFIEKDYLTQREKVDIRRSANIDSRLDVTFGEQAPKGSKLIYDANS